MYSTPLYNLSFTHFCKESAAFFVPMIYLFQGKKVECGDLFVT